MKTSEILKIIIGAVIVLLILSTPILAVFVIWDFEPDRIKDGLNKIISNSSGTNDYNFTIPAAEDKLLPENLSTEDAVNTHIDTNPAVFLRISSANISGPIVHGKDGEEKLKEGFWHHPSSVNPGEIGTSSIFGHRRYHLPPAENTFYHLDKVKNNDMIEIKLRDGTWMEFIVTEVIVVKPSNLNSIITSKSEEPTIKLITCTPLGTSEKRLVVTAKRVL